MSESPEVEAAKLDRATLDRVVAELTPLLTERRLARLEEALATRTRAVTLVLEDIANEHNGAAVLRTAEALGFFEVHVIEPAEGRFKVSERVSKGTDKWLDLRRHATATAAYRELRQAGYQIWASTLHGEAIDVHQIPIEPKVALVFGNELLGLSPKAIVEADGYFRVPMSGFVESFNISVAAAISAYDLWLRRRNAGQVGDLAEEDRRRVRAAWLVRAVKSGAAVLGRAGLPIPVLHTNRFTVVQDDDGSG